MGRKQLILLALLAAVLVALYAWLQRDEKPARVERDALLPGFAGQLASVQALEVRRPGQPAVRVQRGDDGAWRVPAKADYPARASAVVELLKALADARKVEAKTANPALLGRLGLAEDGDPAGQATRLDIQRAGAGPLTLLVGKPARQGRGQLVRLPGESQAWLIDRDIELPENELGWLDRRVAAVPLGDIQRLDLRHADGQRLSLSRQSRKQANFEVAPLPAGRKPAVDGVANGIPGVFSDLSFADAAPRQQATFAQPPVLTFDLHTFDGGRVTGSLYAQGEQYWLVQDSRAGVSDAQWPGRPDWAYRLESYAYQTLAKRLEAPSAKP